MAWLSLKADIRRSLGIINAIDAGQAKGYNRSLFVGSILNKVDTFARKGNVDMAEASALSADAALQT